MKTDAVTHKKYNELKLIKIMEVRLHKQCNLCARNIKSDLLIKIIIVEHVYLSLHKYKSIYLIMGL